MIEGRNAGEGPMGSGGNLHNPSAPEADLFERLASSEEVLAALLVLLLTPVLRILWLGASSVYQYLIEWKGRRVERCTVKLGPIPVPEPYRVRLPKEIPIHCLLIRYGTGSYIAKLASDQERFEGRRRLEVSHHKLVLDRRTCSYSGDVELKVHMRLGTQFKLFIETSSMTRARLYRDLLAGLPEVEDASISHYGPKPKVWLLLKQFHKTRTLDDAEDSDENSIWNNHYWPI
jgi:hypothetical protein